MTEASQYAAGWSDRRLKMVAELRTSNVDKNSSEDEHPVRLCNYTDVYYSSVIDDPSEFMKATATHDEIRRFCLRRGDVLITKDSETADDIAVPAHVARDLDDVLCGYHLAILRPRHELVGRYLYYALLTGRVRDQFTLGANGITRFGLSQGSIKDVRVPVPVVETQCSIASFLDRETTRIDTLTEKKRWLLGLLEEKRTALITRAVTQGLDQNVPMKDSGVEWLGEIPAHWEVVPVRALYRRVKRQGHPTETILSVYREHGVIPKESRDDNANRTPDDLTVYQLVKPADLVINKMKAWQGSLGVAATRGITSPDYVVYSPVRLADPKYIHHLLRCHRLPSVYQRLSNGIRPNQWRLDPSSFERLLIPLPPEDEQKEISSFLNDELERIAALVDRVSDAVAALQEYRTALISMAVEGAIDVKNGGEESREGHTPILQNHLHSEMGTHETVR